MCDAARADHQDTRCDGLTTDAKTDKDLEAHAKYASQIPGDKWDAVRIW